MALRLPEVENEMRVIRQQLQSQQQEIQYYCQQIQLSVEPNPELRSTGTTTAIHDSARSVIVKQWIGFPEKQKALFDEISNAFPPDHRVFESLGNMENLAR
ncbi:hypothetical protein E4U48_005910 [Claviceps purpurea]|nr:hypothetical protein E4U48_005910 [Claviceps purpurea]